VRVARRASVEVGEVRSVESRVSRASRRRREWDMR